MSFIPGHTPPESCQPPPEPPSPSPRMARAATNRRSLSSRGPEHGEIDRDVQDTRAFGEIHSQEKDVAPRAVRQIHANRSPLEENGHRPIGCGLEQLAADAQRLVGWMADAEHPLVAAHRAHT